MRSTNSDRWGQVGRVDPEEVLTITANFSDSDIKLIVGCAGRVAIKSRLDLNRMQNRGLVGNERKVDSCVNCDRVDATDRA